MASSPLNNNVDWNIIEVKSEALTSSTDTKEHLKCLYDYIFHDIEPSNEQKLRILNDVITETTTPDEIRNYYMKRAQIYFNMRDWKNVINDINQIELYGELDGQMPILKIKATLQYEFEEARQLLVNLKNNGSAINYVEYTHLSKTIDQMKGMLECADQSKQSSSKRFRS